MQIDVKQKCICEYCGSSTAIDDSVVLTSNPPKYSYKCNVCGRTGYVSTVTESNFDVHGFRRWPEIKELPVRIMHADGTGYRSPTNEEIANKINELIRILNEAGKIIV